MPNTDSLLKISVRGLVEFVLREGDLPTGFGFVSRDRAVQGTRGHQRVQKSRPDDYEAEVSIRHRVERDGIGLDILGRIDGLFHSDDPLCIDEIKTTTTDLSQIDETYNHLHWAQAKVYAYIYALHNDLAKMAVQLTYYHLDSRQTKEIRHTFTFAELTAFFDDIIDSYMAWAKLVLAWYEKRDASIEILEFPYAEYRTGQREMAVAVYRAIRDGEKLFVQAPTGIGKTIAAQFPAIKAIQKGLVSKIFYLTAKTLGRTVAEKALDDMRAEGLQLKSITLTAKDKICFCSATGDKDNCPYARDYYGKLRPALEDAYQHQAFTRPFIEEIAEKHQLCPFEFSLDLSLWVDCIICDYNYAFDPRVHLRRFFENVTEPYAFLIDESHNLPDRAREMFSAEVSKRAVLDLRAQVKEQLPQTAKALNKINRILLDKRKAAEAIDQTELVEHEVDDALINALRHFVQVAEAWLIFNYQSDFRQNLLDFYFTCTTYLFIAEQYFGPNYVAYFELNRQDGVRAKLYCVDPAPHLVEALKRGQSAVFFSATLLPMLYFEQILTGCTGQRQLQLASPFPRENLHVLVHQHIATKYTQRATSYQPIAHTIMAVCAAQTGNYLVFFPSYAYLEAVREVLEREFPEQSLLVQERNMSEPEREDFLAQFATNNDNSLIALAVMGGIFGEGIDLVGERLIGAIVVGVGIPQLGLERNLIRDYFNQAQRRGFEYAYQYPGLNRVMQAAGRVIRTETDRGVIVLLDERFNQYRYRTLYPVAWHGFNVVKDAEEIRGLLQTFWAK
jgi:DNA excision repair protein ERCC-2